MEDLLFKVEIIPQIIYMSLILLVIGSGLKDIPFIHKWMIIWILMAISISVEFTFRGVSFQSLFEAVISSSIATMTYDVYQQTKKGIAEIKNKNK